MYEWAREQRTAGCGGMKRGGRGMKRGREGDEAGEGEDRVEAGGEGAQL